MTEHQNTTSPAVSRRAVLGAAAAISVLGPTAGRAKARVADEVSVRPDGTYETVPLSKDTVNYACVQHAAVPVDPVDPQPGINRNLKRMVTLIDEHAHWAGPAELLSFGPFSLCGSAERLRDELLAMAIDMPGKETEVLAAKAREYNMWLTFDCYARDPDWPGHVLRLGVLMNPNGEIAAKHWLIPSVYDVLPRYVEMYGWDHVIPVARTPVGNISMIGTETDPLLFAALAVKGCELCIGQSSGSNPAEGAPFTPGYTPYFTSVLSHRGGGNFQASESGYSATQIIGPSGKQLAKALGAHDEIVRATLPLAAYRKTRRVPKTIQHAAARFYGGGR